jgi:methenyltetrahydrofolate cyclohydrolase
MSDSSHGSRAHLDQGASGSRPVMSDSSHGSRAHLESHGSRAHLDQGASGSRSLSEQPLARLLEGVGPAEPLPAGGAVTAWAAALAAALAAKVAGRTGDTAAAATCERLERRAVRLADEDVAAYRAVIDALAVPEDAPLRGEQVRGALSRAADPPLEVAEIAAEVAEIADHLARSTTAALRGDAVVSAHLASGAAAGAAALVRANLGDGDDPRRSRADEAERHARAHLTEEPA